MDFKSDAFAAIKKVFEDPIHNPGQHGYASQSSMELLSSGMEPGHTGSHRYIPAMWADPLLLYKWKIGENQDIVDFVPDTSVCVPSLNGKYFKPELPELSAFGRQLKTISAYNLEDLMSSLSLDEDGNAIFEPKHYLAALLTECDITSIYPTDEAPIMRLLLLQIMISDPKLMVESSSLAHEIAVNMLPEKCSASWMPPPETTDRGQIGTEVSSSTLYFRTIDEFMDIRNPNYCLKDKSLQPVEPLSAIFIPVYSSWSGSWLMAYILGLTTTSWWNHSYTLDVEYSNAMKEATEGPKMTASFMPKAATVKIHGGHSLICLVVVDATRSSMPSDMDYTICGGITATRAGNFDFAKKAYAYLGRLSDPGVQKVSQQSVSSALDLMRLFMCSDKEFRQMHLKASILATSRFNGFGVYPHPSAPPDGRKHIFGPAAFNNKEEIKIGDYVLPDLLKMDNQERQTRLQVFNFWRCDPLGYFTHGSVKSEKDTDHKNFEVWSHCLPQSTLYLRILRASGVFSCSSATPIRTTLGDTLAHASLMLGLTNWAFVELGCTMFDHNCLSYRGRTKDYFHILTDGFVSDHRGIMSERSAIHKNMNKFRWIMNLSEQNDSKSDWIKTHYSGNVPWWYVATIASKFGHTIKIEASSQEDYSPNGFEDDFGWLIRGKEMPHKNYDLSLLSASSQYERKLNRILNPYFPILTLNSKWVELAANMISWDMNRLLDRKKTSRSLNYSHDFTGIVELNAIVLPAKHLFGIDLKVFCGQPFAFVGSDNRINAHDPQSWPHVPRLQYPKTNNLN
ncbi:uncharacterized protein [Drosophila takahashii]|uniref:uncharacterized protein n=1 Tax=Drosophila takahashii TaxID=29030 RepID=UPI003898EE39